MASSAEVVAATKKRLLEAGVQYSFASYVDVHGRPKAKGSPMSAFEKMCKGSELFTVGAMEGLGLIGPQEDECAAVPDVERAVVCPWDHSFAWLPSDLHYHGKPYVNCPRVILKRVCEQARKQGYAFNVGIEAEFYVLRQVEGAWVPITGVPFSGPCPAYDMHLTTASKAFLDPMIKGLDELGWGLYSFDQEGGTGQYELDCVYADALTTADRFVFLRMMAKEYAKQIGAVATWMPKPFHTDFRSGAHFNMSLADAATGMNIFAGKPGKLAKKYGIALPDSAYHFTAGLLAHAPALVALSCPTHNSYKGLLAQGDMPDISWAPVLRCYGRNNRSAMLRLPWSRPCIENRSPDSACNPYLVSAFSLAAGLDGIAKQLDPGKPVNENAYVIDHKGRRRLGVDRLPSTLIESLRAWESDELVGEVFGEDFREIYFKQKLGEWEKGFYRVDDIEREKHLPYI
jgi:glutamine synthetase